MPLLVKVSDTTLTYDRNVKLPLYARAGIGEVWIVNLPARTIEQYTDPSGDRYRRVDHERGGHKLHPAALPDPTVDEILG